jgi:hypothetical protein
MIALPNDEVAIAEIVGERIFGAEWVARTATACGVSRETFNTWRQGKHTPRESILPRLVAAVVDRKAELARQGDDLDEILTALKRKLKR